MIGRVLYPIWRLRIWKKADRFFSILAGAIFSGTYNVVEAPLGGLRFSESWVNFKVF